MAARKYEQKYTDMCDGLYGALQGAYDEGYAAGKEQNRHRGKNLVIAFEDENFGFILCAAVRSALITPETALDVTEFVKPLLPYLAYKTLWTMEQDIKNHAARIKATDAIITNLWNIFHRDVVVAKSRKQK